MRTIIISFLFVFCYNTLFATGIIVLDQSSGSQQTYLRCTSVKADIKIQNAVATTTLHQIFRNTSGARLEGWFLFPVPPGSAISDFKMDVNGKMTSAELMDATKARGIYESIVRKAQDPALMEYAGRELYRIRIFPIEPNSEKQVKITYSQVLATTGGLYEYNLPIAALRKNPGGVPAFTLQVDAVTKENLKTFYSPTHDAPVQRSGKNEAGLSITNGIFEPGADFRLYYSASADPLGFSMMTFFPESEDGYFMMDINPGNLTNDVNPQPKDITFIIDVSGSMEGKKLTQAKKALNYCLNKLSPEDRFDVIRFSTEASALFGKPELNTSANHKKGEEFVNSLQELGGTNIEDAFEVALQNRPASDRPQIVLFITDGKPTIGETDAGRISQRVSELNKNNTRIFSIGVGYDLHTGLLDKIADASGGFRTYIAPEEDLEIKISDVYNKISKPVLTNIRIRADRQDLVFDVYPKKIPDMFAGSGIMLMGRCKQSGTVKLTLSGRYLGREISVDKQITLKADATKSDFIPALWATRKVGWLLDQIRLNGESDELKKEVVSISKKFGIVTPYTSYLIIEDEQRPENVVVNNQRIIRQIPMSSARAEELKDSYKSLTFSSGKASTEGSTAVQEMNQTGNLQQISASVSGKKSNKSDSVDDKITVLANGKTFYRNGSNWTDSRMPLTDNLIGKKVKFASDEYFKLAQDSNIRAWLAVGRNVSFNYRGVNYEIVD